MPLGWGGAALADGYTGGACLGPVPSFVLVKIRACSNSWDEQRAASNLVKHKIAFAEAASVFYDAHAATYPDGEHSYGEPRFPTFGLSDRRRVIVVSHVEIDGGIRIISARRVTREERKIYEEGI